MKLLLMFLMISSLNLFSNFSFANWTEPGPNDVLDWFRNSNAQQHLESFKISSFPRDRKFSITINTRNHGRLPGEPNAAAANQRQGEKAEELRTFLRNHQFTVDAPSIGLSGNVYVSVPIEHPERVKELIDKLNDFERVEPLSIIERMKAKVDSELEGFNRNMAIINRQRAGHGRVVDMVFPDAGETPFRAFNGFLGASLLWERSGDGVIRGGSWNSRGGRLYGSPQPTSSPVAASAASSARSNEISEEQAAFQQRLWEAHVERRTHQRNADVTLDQIRYAHVTDRTQLTESQLEQACTSCLVDATELLNDATKNGLAKFDCGHLMCIECASEWTKYNQICPVCRANIKK